MSDESIQENPLDRLADEFVSRFRRGERPALSEYCTIHPELADDIRRIFPTLVVMEQARPDDEGLDETKGDGATRSRVILERLGDYRILREIARGGMGIVYEAEQESLGRHVALKVLPPQAVLDPRHLHRFQREARAAAKLHHTNIVPVFGVGEHDGLHYYVMQFIPGLGLDQVLDELRRLRGSQKHKAQPRDGGAGLGNDPSLAHRAHVTDVHHASAVQIAASLISGGRVAGTSESRRAGTESASREPEDRSRHAPRDERHHSERDVYDPAIPDSAEFRVRSPSSDPSGSGVNLLSRDTTTLSSSGSQYWQSVARIGVQVTDAMDYAFGQGVLHRDIKPSNLLLDTHGTVWVTDFGLAKATDSDDLTHTGDVVGTLRYLAPERLRGEVNLRGDIYSLGVTLYEMLTLQPPFQDHDRSRLLRRVLDEEPLRPREIDPDIPHDLETIVLKAIAKDPSDRYHTAAELAADLRQFLEDKPIAARPIGPVERLWRWCRRNPRVAGLIGAVAVLLVAITVISSVAAVWLKRERDVARESEQRAMTAETARRQELYRAYLNEARASYITGRQGQRLNGMHAIQNIIAALPTSELTDDQRAELRDEAIAYLALPDLRELTRLPVSVLGHFGLDVNDTLEVCALPSEEPGGTRLSRVDGSGSDIDLPADEAGSAVVGIARTFSPSGRWLVEQIQTVEETKKGKETRARLRVWDWQARRTVLDQRLMVPGGRPIFHPDDRHFMAPGGDDALHYYSLDTGQEERRSPPRIHIAHGNFSADGQWFAACSPHLNAEIIDPVTWETVATNFEFGQASCAAWNPSAPWLVFGGNDGRLYVWNHDTRDGYFLRGGHSAQVLDLVFSDDGHLLVSSGADNMVQIRHMKSDRVLRTPGHAFRFSRDGKRLAIQHDNNLIVYDVVPARAYGAIGRAVESAEFSPDGRWLATASPWGVVIDSADTLEYRANLLLDNCGPVAFHPDGRSLLTFGIFSHAWKWPLTPASLGQRASRIGPPQPVAEGLRRAGDPIAPQHQGRHAAWSRDGRVLAVADYRNGRLLVADSPGDATPREFATLLNVARVAVNPNGEWIAAAAQIYPRARVWSTNEHGTTGRSRGLVVAGRSWSKDLAGTRAT